MYYNQKSNLKVVLGLISLSFVSAVHAAPVSSILFTNETPIALSTSIAGLPGNGVPANTSQPVSYDKVSMGCFWGGNMGNCAINFNNKANGELVATVYINANTATLTKAPVFYGEYAAKYEVNGWEASPITHITISEKA